METAKRKITYTSRYAYATHTDWIRTHGNGPLEMPKRKPKVTPPARGGSVQQLVAMTPRPGGARIEGVNRHTHTDTHTHTHTWVSTL